MVRPQSCRVIYYFDTPTLGIRHQSFDRVSDIWYYWLFMGEMEGSNRNISFGDWCVIQIRLGWWLIKV
jgi:hypothetical protein